MGIEFKKIEDYKYHDNRLAQIKIQFINEEAFEDDYWIFRILSFLFTFYENNKLIDFNRSSEKEITRYIRNWFKKNKDFQYSMLILETESETEGTNQIGYNDMKFTHSFWNGKYFVVECKNLDDSSQSLKEYVFNERESNGGVYRFLINKYSSFLDFGGMLGYVKSGNIDTIIHNIKNGISILQCESNTGIKFGESIEPKLLDQLILNKEHTFQSMHTRIDLETERIISPIQMFHILFNFSNNYIN
ncbi:MAG: hypothetical protein V1720_03415 [bacterium]